MEPSLSISYRDHVGRQPCQSATTPRRGCIIDTVDEIARQVREIMAGLRDYFGARHDWLEAVVLTALATINSIRVFAYVPQIVRAARDRNGAVAISMTTWSLFFASHVTTIAYALVCLSDPVMALALEEPLRSA